MKPDIEWIEQTGYQSFRVYAHDYPHKVAKWHYHPEYELHGIRESAGTLFVGDYVGEFRPGNLVLTGPGLPHNWISDLEPGASVPERDLVLQFPASVIDGFITLFPELRYLSALLHDSNCGVQFGAQVELPARERMLQMLKTEGAKRVQLFIELLDFLAHSADRRCLASGNYCAVDDHRRSATVDQVLAHIEKNLASAIREAEVAELAGMCVPSFSRFFRRSMGVPFVQYVSQARVNLACDLLSNSDSTITDICFRVGFNNVSNFNRQFLHHKRMTPSRFKKYHGMMQKQGDLT